MNFDYLEKEDLYSVTTSLLYSLKDEPKYSIMSELFYILDCKNFINLIKYFGGMEIRVPTREEINETLKVILIYQKYRVEGKTWKESLNDAGIDESLSNSYRMKLKSLENIIESQDIGGRNYK